MRMKARYQKRAVRLAGIMSLVIMPALALAQTARSYTAPAPLASADAKNPEVKRYDQLSITMPSVEIIRVKAGNPENLEPGFYASIKPQSYDTVYVYEGGTEQFVMIGVHAGKEVIHGDSLAVAHDVEIRMNHYNDQDIPVSSEKKVRSNAAIIRSGYIPAQGFGSKRYRFAVKPSHFTLTQSSMISASVYMKPENNIGNVLCSVTSIDYNKGIFYVEASNEIPLGESINWIIVNTP